MWSMAVFVHGLSCPGSAMKRSMCGCTGSWVPSTRKFIHSPWQLICFDAVRIWVAHSHTELERASPHHSWLIWLWRQRCFGPVYHQLRGVPWRSICDEKGVCRGRRTEGLGARICAIAPMELRANVHNLRLPWWLFASCGSWIHGKMELSPRWEGGKEAKWTE